MKKLLLAALFTLALSISVSATPTNKYLKYYDDRTTQYVTAEIGLNVRRQPTTDSQIVGTYNYGDEVQVLSVTEEDEDWTAVYYEGDLKGVFYVHNDYISETKPEPIQQSIIEEDTLYDNEVSYDGNGDYLGTLRLTAYEHDGSLCADGTYPSEYWTCASNELPFGTIVEIAGLGTWEVHDTGAFGYGALDLFLGDPDVCDEFGVQYADVWVVRYGY